MEVRERLGEALAHAATARDRLVDAVGVLSDLDGQHSEPLVPPELRRAGDELERGLHADQRRRGRRRRHRRAAVSLGRRARRERITAAFDAFHAAMGAVLGAAARLTDAAAREHALAMVEMWLRSDGLDAARADPAAAAACWRTRALAAAVARVAADRDAAFEEWLRSTSPTAPAPSASPLDGGARPRAAGDVDGWLAARRRQRIESPDRCRSCGGSARGRSARPVRLPRRRCRCSTSRTCRSTRSPGSAHRGRAGGRRAAAESLVETLLLRVVGYFRPGPRAGARLGRRPAHGSLPGLYPLTRTGLLTVHDPGDLGGLLERAVGPHPPGAHPRARRRAPVAEGAGAATGSRTEPWVVAVLVGDGAPLRRRTGRSSGCCAAAWRAASPWCWSTSRMTIGAPLETVASRRRTPRTGR